MNEKRFEQLISLLCEDLDGKQDLRKVKKEELAEIIKMLVPEKNELLKEIAELKEDNEFKTNLNNTLVENQKSTEELIDNFKKLIEEGKETEERNQELVRRSVTEAADYQNIAARMTSRFKLVLGISFFELIIIILLTVIL